MTNTFTSTVEDFYNQGLGSELLPGEQVLFFSESRGRGYGKKIAITDERVLYYAYDINDHKVLVRRFMFVHLVNVKSVEWRGRQTLKDRDRLHFTVLDEFENLKYYRYISYNYSWDIEEITRVIQTQLDYINKIRNDLGISVPTDVSPSDLRALNTPVVAELRKRRINK